MNLNYMEATKINSDLCSLIAMEECGELIQAISKAKRGKLDKNNLSEEIADVLICIDWLKEIFNIDDERIEHWRNYKEDRVVKKINLGEFD